MLEDKEVSLKKSESQFAVFFFGATVDVISQ